MTAATATRAASAPARNRRAKNRLPNHSPSRQNPYNHGVFTIPAALCRADAPKCDCIKDGNFIDPACGCGNFLVIAYRELRQLNLDILLRLQELQQAGTGGRQSSTTFDRSLLFSGTDLAVRLEHFSGIVLEEWPARIAATALHLADHQANLAMLDALGHGPETLPLQRNDNIVIANALRTDWGEITGQSQHLYVMGNPPFIGQKEKTAAQTADMKLVWGDRYDGYLDYVTGWYKKAVDLLDRPDMGGEFAFVSTNSITQGQPVPALFGYMFTRGWQIRFCHRTFSWTSEAPGAAAVHCVIIGFDKGGRRPLRVFDYGNQPKGEAT